MKKNLFRYLMPARFHRSPLIWLIPTGGATGWQARGLGLRPNESEERSGAPASGGGALRSKDCARRRGTRSRGRSAAS